MTVVQIRLVGASREDLEAVVQAMEAAGVDVRVSLPRSPGRKGDYLAYGTITAAQAGPWQSDDRVPGVVVREVSHGDGLRSIQLRKEPRG